MAVFARTGPYVPSNPAHTVVVGDYIVGFASSTSSAYTGMFAVKNCATGVVRQFKITGLGHAHYFAGWPTEGPDGRVWVCLAAGYPGTASLVAVTPSSGAYSIIPIPWSVGNAHCVSDGSNIWVLQTENGGYYAVKYNVSTSTFTDVSNATSVVMPSSRPLFAGGMIFLYSYVGLASFGRINVSTHVRTSITFPSGKTGYPYTSGRLYDDKYWVFASGGFAWVDTSTYAVGWVDAAAFGSPTFSIDPSGKAYGFNSNAIRITDLATGDTDITSVGSPTLATPADGNAVEYCAGKVHIGSHTPLLP